MQAIEITKRSKIFDARAMFANRFSKLPNAAYNQMFRAREAETKTH